MRFRQLTQYRQYLGDFDIESISGRYRPDIEIRALFAIPVKQRSIRAKPFVDLLIFDSWAFDSGRSQLFPHQVPRQLKHSLDDNLEGCYQLSIDEERAGLVMISG